jgi:hypothetical protein
MARNLGEREHVFAFLALTAGALKSPPLLLERGEDKGEESSGGM